VEGWERVVWQDKSALQGPRIKLRERHRLLISGSEVGPRAREGPWQQKGNRHASLTAGLRVSAACEKWRGLARFWGGVRQERQEEVDMV